MIERKNIEELLPFWINGSLSGEEAREVERALSQDDELRRDEELLRALYDGVKADDTAPSPGEFGLARLMREIDQSEATQPRQSRSGWWPAAVASVAAMAAAIALVLTPALRTAEPTSEVQYEQASGDAGELALTVAFQPGLSQSDLSDALISYDLTIVDGPSAIGLYRVKPLDEEVDLVELADLLQADARVFESVAAPE